MDLWKLIFHGNKKYYKVQSEKRSFFKSVFTKGPKVTTLLFDVVRMGEIRPISCISLVSGTVIAIIEGLVEARMLKFRTRR